MNTISVALTPGVELLPGSNITLSGLIQTQTFDAQVLVNYGGDNSPAGVANFDHESGVLMLTLNRMHFQGGSVRFEVRPEK